MQPWQRSVDQVADGAPIPLKQIIMQLTKCHKKQWNLFLSMFPNCAHWWQICVYPLPIFSTFHISSQITQFQREV